jgi:type III pantothenate kinase
MSSFVAVDIGNTGMKFGLFPAATGPGLPAPSAIANLPTSGGDLSVLADWLRPVDVTGLDWWIGSVNRPAATRLLDWLRDRPLPPRTVLLAAGDLPLEVRLPRPDMVGIDRLLGAVAANVLRPAGQGAIVVDLGTAIKVDHISDEGAFLGGAIMPGIGLSARALHEFTDLLPLIPMSELAEPPAPLGTATVEAMRSGLFWGAIGGIRELIARLGATEQAPPMVYLTGGAAPSVASLLSATASYVPHLTLGGIALAARA